MTIGVLGISRIVGGATSERKDGMTEDQHTTPQPEGVTENPAGWKALASRLAETVGGTWQEGLTENPAWLQWSDDEHPLGVASLDLSHLVGQWDIARFKRFAADLYAVHGYRNMQLFLRYRGKESHAMIIYGFLPSFTPEAFESSDSPEPHDPMWVINHHHMRKKADGKSVE